MKILPTMAPAAQHGADGSISSTRIQPLDRGRSRQQRLRTSRHVPFLPKKSYLSTVRFGPRGSTRSMCMPKSYMLMVVLGYMWPQSAFSMPFSLSCCSTVCWVHLSTYAPIGTLARNRSNSQRNIIRWNDSNFAAAWEQTRHTNTPHNEVITFTRTKYRSRFVHCSAILTVRFSCCARRMSRGECACPYQGARHPRDKIPAQHRRSTE